MKPHFLYYCCFFSLFHFSNSYSFLVFQYFANLCFFNLAFYQFIFFPTPLSLFNQTAGSALQASLTLADIRLGSIRSCIAMWVIEQSDCLWNDHTHICKCTNSHKRPYLMCTKSQEWRNHWGFKNLLLCICFARFPLLRHQCVNKNQTFQEVRKCFGSGFNTEMRTFALVPLRVWNIRNREAENLFLQAT